MTSSLPSIDEYVPVTSSDIALLSACIVLWSVVYYSTVLSPNGKPDGFGESTFVSNLHSVPLCVLAFLSLQHAVPETVPLCWSVGFFLLDFVDAAVRREYMWLVHAVISLALNLCTGCSARHRMLRSVSKGFFAEASTPFLNHWKASKSYASFLVFVLSFTLSRIVWVPYFLYTTYYVTLEGDIDYLIWPSVAFMVLQVAWYVKMVGMVFNYKTPDQIMEERNGKEKESKKAQ